MDNDAKCPVSGGAITDVAQARASQQWWPNQLNLKILHQNCPAVSPMDEDFDYAEEFLSLDLAELRKDVEAVMTNVPGLVARRLRPLRPALHPHGVAQRGHLPHRRRPRGRGFGRAALRPAQQLARQRQPRQGAAPAVVGQAEVRPQDLLGRPDDLRRQLRARVDGVHDLRLRRRPRGHLRARGRRLLGTRGHVARRRALQRRARARQPARRGADGAHLREPRGPQRQPRPARRGHRHP